MAYFSIMGGQTSYMRKILLFSSVALLVLATAFGSVKTLEQKPAGEDLFLVHGAGLDDVIAALKAGNAQELSKYIDDNIEISLPDKSDSYSRAQAIMVLKDFFNSNGVKGFEVQFKGENTGNQYCVGKLVTGSGNYRTTVFMKVKDGKQIVKEIRFQAN